MSKSDNDSSEVEESSKESLSLDGSFESGSSVSDIYNLFIG